MVGQSIWLRNLFRTCLTGLTGTANDLEQKLKEDQELFHACVIRCNVRMTTKAFSDNGVVKLQMEANSAKVVGGFTVSVVSREDIERFKPRRSLDDRD